MISRFFFLSGRALPFVLVLLLSACGGLQDNIFVLLPEADGTVGSIEVSNAQGSQVLDQPNQVVGVTADAAPQPPEPIADEDRDRIFGRALEAEPEPPVTFVLYFQTGGTDLTDESFQQVPSILATVSLRQSPDVAVVGHTDRVGAADFNAALALERATEMRNLLVDAGVDSGVIEVTSHGEGNPLIATADEVAEPRNRRVEITVR